MATRMLRRGLPRVAGGDPWPPPGDVEVADAAVMDAVTEAAPVAEAVPVAAPEVAAAEPVEVSATSTTPNPSTSSGSDKPVRRGLPRTPGGEPWPPSSSVASTVQSPAAATVPAVAETSVAASEVAAAEPVEVSAISTTSNPSTGSGSGGSVAATAGGAVLRRGLPRTPGGEPWPPAGSAVHVSVAETSSPSTGSGIEADRSGIEADRSATETAVATIDVSKPLPFPRTVFAGKNAFVHQPPAPEPVRHGPFTKGQWAGIVIIGGFALLGAAAMAVLFVRWLLSLSGMQDFLVTYPGEYHLPEGAPVGFPGWLGWQHFFNVFLMVLIIRSGLRVRTEKRPTAFWTPRGASNGKVSLTIWFHQSLDILWLINGVVFIVLLFVTGQWMRVIPTSWEVFPNALSAVLQYISLDWPTENGWVNYNSIQQIAYFVTIFLAAPLAAVTGFRMSGMWSKNAEKLNKAYPIEWARALHFPVMLYFVAFIAVHVFLVFATGALRNLNHMFAAQGSVDPNAYADNWTGFWFLVAALVVIAAAWVAARPMVLAPIAKLFGTVSAR